MSPQKDADRVKLNIVGKHLQFDPANYLECEYELDESLFDELQAVETSVLWFTEGKGDEDIGVHFFVRRSRQQLQDDRTTTYRFATTLPHSPLTYDGEILKIRWCVRVKLFCAKSKMITADREFRLGRVGIQSEDLFRGNRMTDGENRAI